MNKIKMFVNEIIFTERTGNKNECMILVSNSKRQMKKRTKELENRAGELLWLCTEHITFNNYQDFRNYYLHGLTNEGRKRVLFF